MNKIDIILPTYNGEKYIKELLDSIINQTYTEFIIIVRDDGSKDNTVKIFMDYKRRYPTKFEVIEDNLGNLGVINNVFEILKYSKSKYIMFCDQDDIWFENKILQLLQCIKQKEKANYGVPIIVHSEVVVVDEELEVLDESYSHYGGLNRKRIHLCNLIQKNEVQGSSLICNKYLLDLSRKLIEKRNYKLVYHDYWFAVLASVFGRIYFYSTPLMHYRQHSNNLVGARRSRISLKSCFKLTISEKNRLRYNNYLITNKEICNVLLKLYKSDLTDEQIKIIYHFKDRPSDLIEFFKLKLYRYYNLKELIVILLFGIH